MSDLTQEQRRLADMFTFGAMWQRTSPMMALPIYDGCDPGVATAMRAGHAWGERLSESEVAAGVSYALEASPRVA